jgi:hypothetical protein
VPELAYRLGLRTREVAVASGDARLMVTAFTPADGRLADDYKLTAADRPSLTSSQLAGLPLIARNSSWSAYNGCG